MNGKYVILCNEQGGILNDPVLLRIAEDEFWFSLSDSNIEWWLRGVNCQGDFCVSIGSIAKKACVYGLSDPVVGRWPHIVRPAACLYKRTRPGAWTSAIIG
jgi:glycine cleavage system aminomethyltransferase T